MEPITILIVDDHAIVRDGMRQLIASQQDMKLVGEAYDGPEALRQVRAITPDVVLLDIAMPGMTGLETIGLIKNANPDIKIVILSMHSKESYVHQALSAGALGYVLKASPSTDILNAIRAAGKNEYFLSSKIRAGVIDAYLQSKQSTPAVRGYDLLTEREQQVFRMVVEGNTTKEIADLLCVSGKTIEKHRTSVTTKLGVHGRLELLKYAIRIGVVDPDLWEE
ncbi:response regulator [Desulfosediminicola ganghwensis]|uniref:response regulator n=1 Tax=Desulfosediminicola ganghwensis TaxID=2569540 RepID=UPI0010ACC1D1|nr:response regulator transcription factor [Desulfosediminicola ganghwensis]